MHSSIQTPQSIQAFSQHVQLHMILTTYVPNFQSLDIKLLEVYEISFLNLSFEISLFESWKQV
jgi:hypothetical protein